MEASLVYDCSRISRKFPINSILIFLTEFFSAHHKPNMAKRAHSDSDDDGGDTEVRKKKKKQEDAHKALLELEKECNALKYKFEDEMEKLSDKITAIAKTIAPDKTCCQCDEKKADELFKDAECSWCDKPICIKCSDNWDDRGGIDTEEKCYLGMENYKPWKRLVENMIWQSPCTDCWLKTADEVLSKFNLEKRIKKPRIGLSTKKGDEESKS
jgi:hypothetical protein